MTHPSLTLAEAKREARELRKARAMEGNEITHSRALELIAQKYGHRDWNTLSAALAARSPVGWAKGDRVEGRYLGQPFAATVLSAQPLKPGWFRLVLELDEAIDSVTFESFSNLRKRIRIEVGPSGHTKERTSDGAPQAEITI